MYYVTTAVLDNKDQAIRGISQLSNRGIVWDYTTQLVDFTDDITFGILKGGYPLKTEDK